MLKTKLTAFIVTGQRNATMVWEATPKQSFSAGFWKFNLIQICIKKQYCEEKATLKSSLPSDFLKIPFQRLGNFAISTDSGLRGGILSEMFQKVDVGAEKMAQSVKCLLCEHEDLSYFSSTHIKSQMCQYAPSCKMTALWRQRQTDRLVGAPYPVSLDNH